MKLADFKNKFTGYIPKLGMVHVYDPARGDLTRPDQANTPPEKALVLPLFYHEVNGQPAVVFEWIIEDPVCPGVEVQVDYAVVECIYPASDYLAVGDGSMLGKHETARYNFDRWVEAQDSDVQKHVEDRLPRSAGAILSDCVEVLGERGKQYDTSGQERSAQRIAAVYNALKGTELTAMDVWDLLMVLKLVRAQDATGVDSRVDLTAYAALSAEEMESIVHGSGPSDVDLPTQTKGVNVAGWSLEALSRLAADLNKKQPTADTFITGIIGDDLGNHIKINLYPQK